MGALPRGSPVRERKRRQRKVPSVTVHVCDSVMSEDLTEKFPPSSAVPLATPTFVQVQVQVPILGPYVFLIGSKEGAFRLGGPEKVGSRGIPPGTRTPRVPVPVSCFPPPSLGGLPPRRRGREWIALGALGARPRGPPGFGEHPPFSESDVRFLDGGDGGSGPGGVGHPPCGPSADGCELFVSDDPLKGRARLEGPSTAGPALPGVQQRGGGPPLRRDASVVALGGGR